MNHDNLLCQLACAPQGKLPLTLAYLDDAALLAFFIAVRGYQDRAPILFRALGDASQLEIERRSARLGALPRTFEIPAMSRTELHEALMVTTVVAQQHRRDFHHDICLVYVAVAEHLLARLKPVRQGATA